MAEQILKVLEPLPNRLLPIYGDNLKAVILFGSYARGTADKESDVDIALLVDGSEEELRNHRRQLSHVSADLTAENQYKWLFSFTPINYGNYTKWKCVLPFYQNIEKEGIPLYVSRELESGSNSTLKGTARESEGRPVLC
ncbi:MAG: nucleotidyltransferase domain-containing protein [Lachnospiraceae bacterium]|nr:nucleotidyltransferase domain-containing protein [Lachnospiraceae bacterium]